MPSVELSSFWSCHPSSTFPAPIKLFIELTFYMAFFFHIREGCKDTCLLSWHSSPIFNIMAAFAVYTVNLPIPACMGSFPFFLSLPFSSSLSSLHIACLSSHSSRCSALIAPHLYVSHVLSLCVQFRSGPQCSPPRRASIILPCPSLCRGNPTVFDVQLSFLHNT